MKVPYSKLGISYERIMFTSISRSMSKVVLTDFLIFSASSSTSLPDPLPKFIAQGAVAYELRLVPFVFLSIHMFQLKMLLVQIGRAHV